MKSTSYYCSGVLRIAFESVLLPVYVSVVALTGLPSLVISGGLSFTEEESLRMHPLVENRMSVFQKDFPNRTSVWLVSNPETGAIAYLSGTVHALRRADLPLPSPFYAAYHQADVIVTESGAERSGGGIDAVQLKAWTRKNRKHLSPMGRSGVDAILQAGTVQALKKLLGRDYEGLRRKSPFILHLKVMQRQSNSLAGMDDIIATQAKRDGKRILRLDSDAIHGTAMKQMDKLLQSYLTEVKESGVDAVFLKAMQDSHDPVFSSFYREGDVEAMNAVYEARKKAGGLFEETLPKRNREWMKKIEGMLGENSPQVEYVLVGGGHLGGDEGLLQLLQNRGFRLQQLFGVDRPVVDKE